MEKDHLVVRDNSSIPPFDDQAHILNNIYVRAGIILVYSIIFLFGFLGNSAVISVVTLQWKARLLSKYYLGSMAAANLSVAFFCVPRSLTLYLPGRWIFGELWCKMFHFVINLHHTASILILFVVSIERHMTLVHGFKGQLVLTARKIRVMTLLVWLLSVAVNLPRFFYCGLPQIPRDDEGMSGKICVLKHSMCNSARADAIYFAVLYALPVAVMSVMYVRLGLFIRRNQEMRSVQVDLGISNDAGRRRILVTPQVDPLPLLARSSAVSTFHGQTVEANNKKVIKVVSTKQRSNSQAKTLGRSTHVPACRGRFARTSRGLVSERYAYGNNQAAAATASEKRRNGFEPPPPGYPRGRLTLSRVRCQKREDEVRMLKYVVITFALLNLPFHVLKLCRNFSPSIDASSDVNNLMVPLTFILMYANCAVNPVLYVLMSRRFRGSLRDLIMKSFGTCSRTPVSL